MRLSAKEMAVQVGAMPGSARPIRLRGGGLQFQMTCAEAVELATQLADAVDEIRNHERNQQ
ncbi:hypothetical protein AU191_01050 [Mycolicibacterium acapulense]|nr:hypothetical protein AU191_01050 [Mycolicibacterium acapulense]